MSHDFRWWLKVACILVLITGALLTAWNVQTEDHIQRNNLLIKAKIAANCLDYKDIEALSGSEADLDSSVYLHMKRTMEGVVAADRQVRFAYLMGMNDDGEIFFFVDSESPDSKDYSPPGQIYSEATVYTIEAFTSGKEMTAGPDTDRWGTWITAFIPVKDPDTGDLYGIFGLDVDANNWVLILLGAALPPILGTGMVLILTLSFLVILERNEKEREILSSSQKAIQESEARYRLLFTRSPVGVVQVDRDGTIVMANQKCGEILGMTPDEMTGIHIHTQLQDPGLSAALRDIPKGKPTYYEGEYRSLSTGKVSSVRILAHPIFSDNNEYSGAIATIEDITERKQAEKALLRANQKLNLLNSITRHDILNQLLALKGYLELAGDPDADNQQQRNFLEKAKKVTTNIERQINFTKDYQDMGVKSATWQDIGLAITRARGALPLEHLQVMEEGIVYEIFADPLFEKVFYNLFENSLKHGGEGLKAIRVSAQETKKGLMILYEDDGVGIPADIKEHLFDQEITPQRGLGMFLTSQILSITGISIAETGVPGKGVRFEILVPEGGYRKKSTPR
jgi:PAS domain S-box-containing protein